MKQVIREVKDLKGYTNIRNGCLIVSLIIAFFVNSITVYASLNSVLIIISFVFLTAYSYLFCIIACKVFTSGEKSIKKRDFDVFLENKGQNIISNKKRRLIVHIPLSNTVVYYLVRNDKSKMKYVFNLKKNTFSFNKK